MPVWKDNYGWGSRGIQCVHFIMGWRHGINKIVYATAISPPTTQRRDAKFSTVRWK